MNTYRQAVCSHEGGKALEEPLHSCCAGGSCAAQVDAAAFMGGSENEINSMALAVSCSCSLKV